MVMCRGEGLQAALPTGGPQSASQIWIRPQQRDSLCHRIHITFFHQKPSFSVKHNFRYTGMACGYHWQSTQLGLHHRNWRALLVSIRSWQRVLYEAAGAP